MKIVIELKRGKETDELSRYDSDVCPRIGETVSLPGDGKLDLFIVLAVDHLIMPHYTLASVFVKKRTRRF